MKILGTSDGSDGLGLGSDFTDDWFLRVKQVKNGYLDEGDVEVHSFSNDCISNSSGDFIENNSSVASVYGVEESVEEDTSTENGGTSHSEKIGDSFHIFCSVPCIKFINFTKLDNIKWEICSESVKKYMLKNLVLRKRVCLSHLQY